MKSNFQFAILLTTIAGLSTVVGSALGILFKKPGNRFMAITLGFAAGVMLLVSFAELLPEASADIGAVNAYLAFFLGFILMGVIDVLIPHDYMAEKHEDADKTSAQKLRRTGLFVALGIGIHNLPEGMVTLSAALKDTNLGIAVAVAIGLHNIPEGLAVSVPIYAATGSRKKAFLWSLLSGVAEPLGAMLAYLILNPFMTPTVLGWMLSAVGGLMVYISLDELIPSSREYGHDHLSIVGVGAGMAIMALSLELLAA